MLSGAKNNCFMWNGPSELGVTATHYQKLVSHLTETGSLVACSFSLRKILTMNKQEVLQEASWRNGMKTKFRGLYSCYFKRKITLCRYRRIRCMEKKDRTEKFLSIVFFGVWHECFGNWLYFPAWAVQSGQGHLPWNQVSTRTSLTHTARHMRRGCSHTRMILLSQALR